MPQRYIFLLFMDIKQIKKCLRIDIFVLSWTSFNIKSVHENAFVGFRGQFHWKIESRPR